MSKPVRVVLVVLAVLGVVAGARRAGVLGGNATSIPTGVQATLPLSCRLRGHGWKMPANNTQTPTRRTCQKCQRIDVPMP